MSTSRQGTAIRISVTCPKNVTSEVDVLSTDTIEKVKEKIQKVQKNVYPRLIEDNDKPLENHKLVSDYGIKNGDHFRTAKAKHKKVNPTSRVRRQQKASKLREELDAIVAKMSPEESAAFYEEVAQEEAQDELNQDGALRMDDPHESPVLPTDLTAVDDDAHSNTKDDAAANDMTSAEGTQCQYANVEYLAFYLVKNRNPNLLERLAKLLENAKDEYGDGCLHEDYKRKSRMEIKARCPGGCSATYKQSEKGALCSRSGHKSMIRTCLVLKMNEGYSLHDDHSIAEAAAEDLLEQKDNLGRSYDISHYCCVPANNICLNPSHFGLETKQQNCVRKTHQNGNVVCNCADLGLKPCLINGKIGEKVEDGNGAHVGWKAASEPRESKRRKVAR